MTVRVRLLLRERGPARGRRRGAYTERCWPVLRTNPGRRQRAAWACAGTARSTSTGSGKVTLACPGLRARQDKGAAGGLPLAHSLRLVGALAKCDATRSLPLRGCGSAGWRELKFTALRRDSEDRHRRAPESLSLVPSRTQCNGPRAQLWRQTTLSTPPLPSHGGTHGRSMRCGACEPTTTIRQARRVARQGGEDRLRCGQRAAVGAAWDRPLHFVLPEPHA